MKHLLIADAFVTAFIGSLRAQHNLWQMGRHLERIKQAPPGAYTYGGSRLRIWHLWL